MFESSELKIQKWKNKILVFLFFLLSADPGSIYVQTFVNCTRRISSLFSPLFGAGRYSSNAFNLLLIKFANFSFTFSVIPSFRGSAALRKEQKRNRKNKH